jgi:DNA-directed RNA polymerase subunit M/transcription elongation factor TFIIS
MNIRQNYVSKFSKYMSAEEAEIVEKSCYKYTISTYQSQDLPPLKSWDDVVFKGIYDSKCGFLLSILNQTKINSELFKRKDIAKLKMSELCPDLISDDEILVKKRSEQKIEVKTSIIYKCPFCGEYKSKFIEKGTRGSDEAKDILCFCTACKQSYKGN